MATRTVEPLSGLGQGDATRTATLRNDIVETRDRMGRTALAIEERLSPKHIKEQVTSLKEHVIGELKDARTQIKGEVSGEIALAKEKVRDATIGRVQNMVHEARQTVTGAGSTTIDAIKTNPIPAAMIAVGLGWLVSSGIRGGGAARGRVDERIQARSRGRQVVRRAGVRARRTEQSIERSIDESPLVYGAVAVAIGAAIGLLLPRTDVEDRLIGDKKDLLLDTARSRAEGAARQALSTVQERAASLTESLKSDGHGRARREAEGSELGAGRGRGGSGQYENGLSSGLPRSG